MKKYCTNCGELIPNLSKLCPNCGEKQRKQSDLSQNFYDKDFSQESESDQQFETSKAFQSFNYSQKIPILAKFPFILALPGLGHILAGQKQKGKRIMAITFTLVFFAFIIPFTTEIYFTIYFLNPIIAFLFIGAFVDGIRQLRKHNELINQQDQIPSQKAYTAQ
ncbi:MAG: hypothetical protein ACW96U_07075 [Candidatus Heimdallarchaeaceae archaeon]|jgi:hypothetical protein